MVEIAGKSGGGELGSSGGEIEFESPVLCSGSEFIELPAGG